MVIEPRSLAAHFVFSAHELFVIDEPFTPLSDRPRFMSKPCIAMRDARVCAKSCMFVLSNSLSSLIFGSSESRALCTCCIRAELLSSFISKFSVRKPSVQKSSL